MREVGDQLVVTAMELFQKLVDIHKSFHLTLINVCFAKLESKVSIRSLNISNFFTKVSKNEHQENTTHTLDVSQTKVKRSPTNKLLRWMSGRKTETCMDSGKRPTNSDMDTNPSKRMKIEVECVSVEYDHRSDMMNKDKIKCPPNIDPTVFSELPLEIQQEILTQGHHSSSESPLKDVKTVMSGNKKKTFFDAYESKMQSANTQEGRSEHQDVVSPCGENSKTQTVGQKINCISNDFHCGIDKSDVVSSKFDKGDNKQQSATCSSTSDEMGIPPNIDKATFLELPPGVQTELINNWKQQSRMHSINKTKDSKAAKSIANYFKKQ